MLIGERIRQLRIKKGLSQGDVEKASGLLRCYVSRIENGYTTPSLETLERFASALDVPLYELFYDGDGHAAPRQTPRRTLEELAEETGPSGAEARLLLKLKGLAGKMTDDDRALLMEFARKLSSSTARETGRRGERRTKMKPVQPSPNQQSF